MENKRIWDAFKLYYGISKDLEFMNKTRTQLHFNGKLYIYAEDETDIITPHDPEKYSEIYFVTGNPNIITFIRHNCPEYGCFCYADNYGLGYLYTVTAPNHTENRSYIKVTVQ